MKKNIPGGVWPTMITPFTPSGAVDEAALDALTDWYAGHGADGLFAVCQSSEMFSLTLEERVSLATAVCRSAARVGLPVIASGHISDRPEDQIEELCRMAETGISALVLITNRLAGPEEDDTVWMENLKRLLEKLPEDMPLGFYECPYPYKRLITDEQLKFCADTGRFTFLKDTCCDADVIRGRLAAVKGSDFRIYNANTATLLETLHDGVAGYSGVMGNFHPELYQWMIRNYTTRPEACRSLNGFLSLASQIERQYYPVNAKYFLHMEGVLECFDGRTKKAEGMTPGMKKEIAQFRELSLSYTAAFAGDDAKAECPVRGCCP